MFRRCKHKYDQVYKFDIRLLRHEVFSCRVVEFVFVQRPRLAAELSAKLAPGSGGRASARHVYSVITSPAHLNFKQYWLRAAVEGPEGGGGIARQLNDERRARASSRAIHYADWSPDCGIVGPCVSRATLALG
ncbi:hypothetical protein EVAR_81647_1 [Eumeta japonica]|uniref:Uncharacterized protein n=1 Tax=Eumeta variegata TaxID=151549 RepID=A0A4C1V2V5_EUMVA|nr:hypothetical protein EVAR_81647_1 [Eumeta japonica]